MMDEFRNIDLSEMVTTSRPPDPPPAPRLPLPTSERLVARIEALRSAALTSERSGPAGAVLDRAEEFERWLTRGLDGGDPDW